MAASMENVLAVILGGGRGSRLFPLTQQRSKPAVPIAGKYRLIDIPISNCINSGIFRIAVLTQFNSVSLHRHITSTYNFDVFHQGWVQIWAAEQTMETTDWYQGTADAVRKQLFEIYSSRAENILILAGDHLYRMDFQAMVQYHLDNAADITVAVQPVKAKEASRFGILKRDSNGRIVRFAEKPTAPDLLADLVSRDDPERPYLGSMGIYLFKSQILFDLLQSTSYDDFGKHIIPYAISVNPVYGFDFDGYWEDIGTIRTFYEANLALTDLNPQFNLFDPNRPIYTHARFLPPTIVENSVLENVLLAEGCSIKYSEIRHSVIGVRSRISNGTRIFDSILMGSDYLRRMGDDTGALAPGIGENCFIQGAIIDKNTRIGDNVVIRPFPHNVDFEEKDWIVRDGIVIIPKNTTLPSNTVIGPER